jgi:hypothetical protein
MQFVQHDEAQAGEEAIGIARRDQQGKLFGRRQENVGRHQLLSLPLVRRRVAGAGFDRHRQVHLADRPREIALDIDGQCLER